MLREDSSGPPRSPFRARLTYPTYFPRTGEKRRRRVFAWMSVSHKHNSIEVLDEYGTTFRFGIAEYEALRDTAIAHGWCLFAKFGSGIAGRYPFLRQTLHDERATVLASPRKVTRAGAITGIEWRRGNKRAKVVDPDSWGFSQLVREGVHVSAITFLMYCRKCCELVAVGDYDTPAALGAAKLANTWQSSGLRKLWRLPKHLRNLLESNPVHPRIYDVDTPAVYGLLRERDLRSAYAHTLAGDLPLAQPCYVAAGEATPHVVRSSETAERRTPSQQVGAGISFGQWEVTVPEPIVYGPVSRIWKSGQSASFHIEQGVYTVPLWGEEANALAEIGCTLTWKGGYLWLKVGAPWEGMVNDINGLRTWADGSSRPILSEMLKRLPNSVVGRWHCLRRCEIVPEERAVEGDILFPLDWDGNAIPDECAALHTTESEDCLPQHWYSYIVMKVGLQIWRAQREELRRGYTVVSANIDSYRVVQHSLDYTEAIDSPLEWKEFLIRDAYIDAARHIDGWKSTDGGVTWSRMIRAPGIKRE